MAATQKEAACYFCAFAVASDELNLQSYTYR